MRRLLNSYKKTLRVITEELTSSINEGTDFTRIIKLTVQRKCYLIFITDLEKLCPPEKPVDQKAILEAKKLQEQRDKEEQDKLDDWNRRMLAGEFESKEPETPKGF